MNYSKLFKVASILIILFAIAILYSERRKTVTLLELNQEELILYFEKYNSGDSANAVSAFRKGFLQDFQHIEKQKVVIKKDKDLQESHIHLDSNSSILDSLEFSLARDYLFFPDYMKNREDRDFLKNYPLPLIHLLIKTGVWTPECGAISQIFARHLVHDINNMIVSKPIHLPDLRHVVTGIKYERNNHTHVAILDAQNGFWGPFYKDSGQLLTIEQIEDVVTGKENIEVLELRFLDDHILRNKKKYIPHEYALNIFPDSSRDVTIYQAPTLNYHYAYRKSYSVQYYLWFYHQSIDQQELIKHIANQITTYM